MNWIKHLFWLIGLMTISLFKLKFDDVSECYYWITIHLQYDSRLESEIYYTSLTERLKMNLITILGIIVFIFIISVIFLLFRYILLLPKY